MSLIGAVAVNDGVVTTANTQAWGYWDGSIPNFFCDALKHRLLKVPEDVDSYGDAVNGSGGPYQWSWEVPIEDIADPVAVTACGPPSTNGTCLKWFQIMMAGMASIEAPESGSTRMKTVGLLQAGETVKLDHVVWNDGLDSDAAGRIWFRGRTAA